MFVIFVLTTNVFVLMALINKLQQWLSEHHKFPLKNNNKTNRELSNYQDTFTFFCSFLSSLFGDARFLKLRRIIFTTLCFAELHKNSPPGLSQIFVTQHSRVKSFDLLTQKSTKTFRNNIPMFYIFKKNNNPETFIKTYFMYYIYNVVVTLKLIEKLTWIQMLNWKGYHIHS